MYLHLLCGIPGSGKSTLTKRLPGYVVSTDSLRKFLWGDESVIKHDKFVFNIAEKITAYNLNKKIDVIFDATNLRKSRRKRLSSLAQKHDAGVVLHWVDCSLETALKRNSLRERKVPEEVIIALYKSVQKPSPNEGLDILKVYNEDLALYKYITGDLILRRWLK